MARAAIGACAVWALNKGCLDEGQVRDEIQGWTQDFWHGAREASGGWVAGWPGEKCTSLICTKALHGLAAVLGTWRSHK
jgi:hypothetical protein